MKIFCKPQDAFIFGLLLVLLAVALLWWAVLAYFDNPHRAELHRSRREAKHMLKRLRADMQMQLKIAQLNARYYRKVKRLSRREN